MKTVDKKVSEIVETLYNIVEIRKTSDRLEKELKAKVKQFMGLEVNLETDMFAIVLSNRIRKSLNLDMVKEAIGPELMAKCETTTKYEVMEIVPKAGVVSQVDNISLLQKRF